MLYTQGMPSRLERAAQTNAEQLQKMKRRQVEIITEMKEQGYSLARMAEATSLSRTGVRDILLRNGVPTS